MAIKEVYIGSIGPFYYDDSEDIPGLPGTKQKGLHTDGEVSAISITTSGASGTITVLTAMQKSGSDYQYKTRSLTFADGLITTIGTESGWTTA